GDLELGRTLRHIANHTPRARRRSEGDDLVVGTGGLERVVESQQELGAVAGEDGDAGDFALLQVLVGEQRRDQLLGVLADFLLALEFGARYSAAQAPQLVAHLLFRASGGFRQRRVEALERLAQRSQ